jgi:ApaG protein
MSGTRQDRQPRVLRILGLGRRAIATHEAAAARRDDDAGVTTGGAETGRWLLRVGTIVHHGVMFTSEATTRGVRVAVVSEYAPGRSRPQDRQWVFLYTITITNAGGETVQLLSRHWIITDGNGDVEEVRGPGVVGEQPVLEPNESFTYTSGCPLGTSFGKMEGTYQMVTGSGEHFDVQIAPFTLSEPYTVH